MLSKKNKCLNEEEKKWEICFKMQQQRDGIFSAVDVENKKKKKEEKSDFWVVKQVSLSLSCAAT